MKWLSMDQVTSGICLFSLNNEGVKMEVEHSIKNLHMYVYLRTYILSVQKEYALLHMLYTCTGL